LASHVLESPIGGAGFGLEKVSASSAEIEAGKGCVWERYAGKSCLLMRKNYGEEEGLGKIRAKGRKTAFRSS
jgi:hypothetical protein